MLFLSWLLFVCTVFYLSVVVVSDVQDICMTSLTGSAACSISGPDSSQIYTNLLNNAQGSYVTHKSTQPINILVKNTGNFASRQFYPLSSVALRFGAAGGSSATINYQGVVIQIQRTYNPFAATPTVFWQTIYNSDWDNTLSLGYGSDGLLSAYTAASNNDYYNFYLPPENTASMNSPTGDPTIAWINGVRVFCVGSRTLTDPTVTNGCILDDVAVYASGCTADSKFINSNKAVNSVSSRLIGTCDGFIPEGGLCSVSCTNGGLIIGSSHYVCNSGVLQGYQYCENPNQNIGSYPSQWAHVWRAAGILGDNSQSVQWPNTNGLWYADSTSIETDWWILTNLDMRVGGLLSESYGRANIDDAAKPYSFQRGRNFYHCTGDGSANVNLKLKLQGQPNADFIMHNIQGAMNGDNRPSTNWGPSHDFSPSDVTVPRGGSTILSISHSRNDFSSSTVFMLAFTGNSDGDHAPAASLRGIGNREVSYYIDDCGGCDWVNWDSSYRTFQTVIAARDLYVQRDIECTPPPYQPQWDYEAVDNFAANWATTSIAGLTVIRTVIDRDDIRTGPWGNNVVLRFRGLPGSATTIHSVTLGYRIGSSMDIYPYSQTTVTFCNVDSNNCKPTASKPVTISNPFGSGLPGWVDSDSVPFCVRAKDGSERMHDILVTYILGTSSASINVPSIAANNLRYYTTSDVNYAFLPLWVAAGGPVTSVSSGPLLSLSALYSLPDRNADDYNSDTCTVPTSYQLYYDFSSRNTADSLAFPPIGAGTYYRSFYPAIVDSPTTSIVLRFDCPSSSPAAMNNVIIGYRIGNTSDIDPQSVIPVTFQGLSSNSLSLQVGCDWIDSDPIHLCLTAGSPDLGVSFQVNAGNFPISTDITNPSGYKSTIFATNSAQGNNPVWSNLNPTLLKSTSYAVGLTSIYNKDVSSAAPITCGSSYQTTTASSPSAGYSNYLWSSATQSIYNSGGTAMALTGFPVSTAKKAPIIRQYIYGAMFSTFGSSFTLRFTGYTNGYTIASVSIAVRDNTAGNAPSIFGSTIQSATFANQASNAYIPPPVSYGGSASYLYVDTNPVNLCLDSNTDYIVTYRLLGPTPSVFAYTGARGGGVPTVWIRDYTVATDLTALTWDVTNLGSSPNAAGVFSPSLASSPIQTLGVTDIFTQETNFAAATPQRCALMGLAGISFTSIWHGDAVPLRYFLVGAATTGSRTLIINSIQGVSTSYPLAATNPTTASNYLSPFIPNLTGPTSITFVLRWTSVSGAIQDFSSFTIQMITARCANPDTAGTSAFVINNNQYYPSQYTVTCSAGYSLTQNLVNPNDQYGSYNCSSANLSYNSATCKIVLCNNAVTAYTAYGGDTRTGSVSCTAGIASAGGQPALHSIQGICTLICNSGFKLPVALTNATSQTCMPNATYSPPYLASCIDINECTEISPPVCGPHATCYNTFGGFRCSPYVVPGSLRYLSGPVANPGIVVQASNISTWPINPSGNSFSVATTLANQVLGFLVNTSFNPSLRTPFSTYLIPDQYLVPGTAIDQFLKNNSATAPATFPSSYTYVCNQYAAGPTTTANAIVAVQCILPAYIGTSFHVAVWSCLETSPTMQIASQLNFSAAVNQSCLLNIDAVDTVIMTSRPAFVDGTIETSEAPNGGGSGVIATTLDAVISMTMTNWIADSNPLHTSVTINAGGFTCAVQAGNSSYTKLACIPQPSGQGYRLTFTAFIPGFSVSSHDTYDYPAAPTLTNITVLPSTASGCTINPKGVGLFNCSTAGGALLTLSGSNFIDQATMSVFINGALCQNLTLLDNKGGNRSTQVHGQNSTLTCILQEGRGSNQTVVVSAINQFSASYQWVSYGAPVIKSIQTASCAALGIDDPINSVSRLATKGGCCLDPSGLNNINPTGCSRGGRLPITLTGSNFGRSLSTIYIGTSICDSIVHDPITPHNKLTCIVPAGKGAKRSIVLIQNNGAPSTFSNSNVSSLSFQPCSPGLYDSSDFSLAACQTCAGGTFSAISGATSCSICSAGSYAAAGSSYCSSCVPGRYSADGSSDCPSCNFGSFSARSGQSVSCNPCSLGTYSNSIYSTQCQAARAGTLPVCTYMAGISCASTYQPPCFLDTAAGQACALNPSGLVPIPPSGDYRFVKDPNYLNTPLSHPNAPPSAAWYYSLTDLPSARGGASSFMNCSGGSYSAALGQTVCLTCVAGTFAHAGSSVCSLCEGGKYALSNASSCSLCSAGTYSPSGSSFCSNCTGNSYAPSAGQADSCILCPAGKSVPQWPSDIPTGPTFCTPCRVNTASSADGLDCIPCTAGYQANITGKSCDFCQLGQFTDANNNHLCTECPNGFYAPALASPNCFAAPNGTYARRIGGKGAQQATACALGRFQSLTGQSDCIDCPLGQFTDTFNSPSCTNCPPVLSSMQTSLFLYHSFLSLPINICYLACGFSQL
jgi:hypothetical protein